MMLFYPSYQAMQLADQILDSVGKQVEGYQGRIGTQWFWRLAGGILVSIRLDYTVTEQRWDVLRAQAATPNVGHFSAVDFPFVAYGTLMDSPPFIHDLDGDAEWSNRIYFQMGHLIEDAVQWMQLLLAVVIDPQIRPPSAFPELNGLEREIVAFVLDQQNGYFRLDAIHKAFAGRISRGALLRLGQSWEDLGLLTERPRRVTVALRALAARPE